MGVNELTVADLIEMLHRAPLGALVRVDVGSRMGVYAAEAVASEPKLGRYTMPIHSIDIENFLDHNTILLEL